MGVKGLWKLLDRSGVPIPLESLEQKILAVDVSIWLHQAVHGFRSRGGGTVANAHLLTLFHRLCKLLFYRIRPVFVFDGGVPQLKKQTMASRRLRREVAAKKVTKVRERLLASMLKSHALKKAHGLKGLTSVTLDADQVSLKAEKDIFELPPLVSNTDSSNAGMAITGNDSDEEEDNILNNLKLPNLHQFEFESDQFKALALEAQHEILSELQDTRKQSSWGTLNQMPEEALGFSDYQMERLLKRRRFQETLDGVRSKIRQQRTAEIEAELFGALEKHVSLTHRISSEDASHSILVKKCLADKTKTEKVEKGKSIMKKDKAKLEKDFLLELQKQGIAELSEADSDDSYENCLNIEGVRLRQDDEEALLNIMDTVIENCGLTQQEILSIIQKDSSSVLSKKKLIISNDDLEMPSTSSNAPGFMYVSDKTESSDSESDLIEVPDSYVTSSQNVDKSIAGESKHLNSSINQLSSESSNAEQLLRSNSSSLYIKIVQQKLDDIINFSPKKASADTRISSSKFAHKVCSSPGDLEIALDLNQGKFPVNDDIFANVFSTGVDLKEVSKIPIDDLLARECCFKQKKYEKQSSVVFGYDDFSQIENQQSDKGKEDACKSNFVPVTLQQNYHEQKSDNVQFSESNVVEEEPVVASNVCTAVDGFSDSLQVTDLLRSKVSELIKYEIEKMVGIESGVDIKETSMPYSSCKVLSQANNSAVNNVLQCPGSSKIDSHTQGLSCNKNYIEDEIMSSSDENDELEVRPKAVSVQHLQNNCAKQRSSTTDEDKTIKVIYIKDSFAEDKSAYEENATASNLESLKMLLSPDIMPIHKNINIIEDCGEHEMNSVQPPVVYTSDEFELVESRLQAEQKTLISEVRKAERIASNLTDQMYSDAQELLQLFGMPYLVAPMEAEAQCAFLDCCNLTNGTITDDSDIFLFGGTKVYKNFFDNAKHVESFESRNIHDHLGLDRQKLICLAMLTGSDYSNGVESVGSVLAMEILSEFHGEGIECLKSLKKWWTSAHCNQEERSNSKVLHRLAHLNLPECFPNETIFNAYLQPDVDNSQEKFTWAIPNVNAIREFVGDKFGWNNAKADEILLPVIQRLGIKENQTRIDSFFTTINFLKEQKHASKRTQEAISRVKGEQVVLNASATKKMKMSEHKHNQLKWKKTSADAKNTLNSKMSSTTPIHKTKKSDTGCVASGSNVDLLEQTLVSSNDTGATEDVSELTRKEEFKKKRFKKLLQKEVISQCERDKKDMTEKKLIAAVVLKQKIGDQKK